MEPSSIFRGKNTVITSISRAPFAAPRPHHQLASLVHSHHFLLGEHTYRLIVVLPEVTKIDLDLYQ
jgi:hypothetical protein